MENKLQSCKDHLCLVVLEICLGLVAMHCPLIGLLAVPAVSKTLNPNWFQCLDQCFAW